MHLSICSELSNNTSMVAAVFFYYGPPASGKSIAISQRVRREHTAYMIQGGHFCHYRYGRPVWPLNDDAITDIVLSANDGRVPCMLCLCRAVELCKNVHVEMYQDPQRSREFFYLARRDRVGGVFEFQPRRQDLIAP